MALRYLSFCACLAVFLTGCASGPPTSGADVARVVYPKPNRFTPLTQPEYPLEMRTRGLQAVVAVDVLIGADGEIKDARILMSSGHLQMDESTLKEVRTWRRFVAGQINGKLAAIWNSYFITFALPGGPPLPDQKQAMAEALAKIKQRGVDLEARAAAEAAAP